MALPAVSAVRAVSCASALVSALVLGSCGPAVRPTPTPTPIPPSPPGPPTAAPPVVASVEAAHLVIDIGSSGTRFCVYRVSRPGAGAGRCQLATTRAVCSKSKGGLAKLTKGKPAADVPAIIGPNLRSAWESLADPNKEGGSPEDAALRGKVQSAAALGTGGFRDSATGQPVDLATRPEWKAVFTEVERFLRDEAHIPSVTVRPITGEEEGRLAWLGLTQAPDMQRAPRDFATIETGGATIQLAVGQKGARYADVQVATEPRGQDVVFDRLAAAAKDFGACYSPKDRKRQDGERCLALLREQAFKGAAVQALAESTPPRRLYGLGLPWGDLFKSYPAAPPWPKKEDSVMHEKLTLPGLQKLAVKLCPLTDDEIAVYAPRAFSIIKDPATGTSTGRTCFYVAYHAAFFEAVRHAAASDEIFSADEDQWSRGAAVTRDFFEACK